MSVFRVLRYLVLVLALVAGGIAPGFAQAMHPAEPAAVEAPCHGMDGELVPAATMVDHQEDCCQGGDCRCDCLQHATAGLLALRPLMPVQHARLLAALATSSHAPAPALPAIRPPIA